MIEQKRMVESGKAAATMAYECAEALTDQAGAFTCREADVIEKFLTLWGPPGAGDAFRKAHRCGDSEGDEHFGDSEGDEHFLGG